MFGWLVRRLIGWWCVRSRVYREGHLMHADGSLYMGRWRLFETRWISARLHYIASDDADRVLHDHPWNFMSLVLSGGYIEQRPITVEPCFPLLRNGQRADWEAVTLHPRTAGSVAFRRATERHRVVDVAPRTYTLFIYWQKTQWWGFYTREGKVHWRDFVSCHTTICADPKRREA